MSRKIKYGVLLIFSLIIVFGVSVINRGDAYARYDEIQTDSCYSIYYSKDKNGKNYNKATICEDDKGELYVDNNDLNLYGPHFEISDEGNVCFAVPGGGTKGCVPYLSGRLGSSVLMAAVEKTARCNVNGSSIECSYSTGSGQAKYYVSDNIESISKPNSDDSGSSGSSGNSGGSGGTTVDSDGFSGSSGGLDDASNEEEVTCMNSGAAQSLGWIACVILDLTGNAAEKIYEYVEPNLALEPRLFGGNNEVQGAWASFRDIANVLFVILLLFVIFSQLTGVGIDNYGIKKILPKLIVAAILINLSYLICILLVDVSNIAGNGFQTMFDRLSSNQSSWTINIPRADGNGDYSADVEASGKGLVTAGVVAALVGGGAAVILNPAIIISLLVSIIGVLISFFFLFILLAAREAAIVVLVVISPLAVACYMLPNTKKFFDKWVKFFEGLLLVYPICGLLIGGGNFVSRLLLSSNGWLTGISQALTAMLVGILPIFFLPTVLKSSFAAMGTIGSKLAGFGERMSGGATRRMRAGDGYKAIQAKGAERRNRMLAGYNSKGQVTGVGNALSKLAKSRVGRAVGFQGLQAARVANANKSREQNIQQNAELSDVELKYNISRHPERSTEDVLRGQLQDAANSGDANAIFATIEQMKKSNMQQSHIAQATRDILGGRNIGNMTDGQRKNFLEEFGKKYSGDFLKKDFEQADWARKGGVGQSGVAALGPGGQWANDEMSIDDMKDEDVAALSSDRLSDLIRVGRVSRPQAQRVWASNSNMDDSNRLILGAYGNEGIGLSKEQAQFELNPNSVGPRRFSQEQIAAYTERAASDVVIRDVRKRDAQGQHQQTDRLEVELPGEITEAPASTPTVDGGSGASGGAPTPSPVAGSGTPGGAPTPRPATGSGTPGDLRGGGAADGGEFRVRDIGDRLSSESRDLLSGETGRVGGAGGTGSSGKTSGRSGGTPSDYAPGDPVSAGGE